LRVLIDRLVVSSPCVLCVMGIVCALWVSCVCVCVCVWFDKKRGGTENPTSNQQATG